MTEALTLELTARDDTDFGRGLMRLPIDQMTLLGLRPGDTVAIDAGRRTHARAIPCRRGGLAEAGRQTILNAGGQSGRPARVEAVNLPTLASVLVSMEGGGSAAPQDLKDALFDLAVTEGDRIAVPGPKGRAIELLVIAATPAPAGLIGSDTVLTLASRPGPQGYDEIGGLESQIARIHEMVATPLLRPDLFAHLGIPPPRGVLFTGPPGSGKTLLARTIATRTSAAFFQVNGPEIVSKHYGESEAALRNVFDEAARNAPAIIFIDEIDAIAPRRDSLSGEKQLERRVVAQLLTLMDGLSDRGGVIVMAATNLPDSLDPALRRPGRFDREISFTPPDANQRREILAIHLRNAPMSSDVDLSAIADVAHGYVGADLAALAREASLAALDRAVSAAGTEAQVRTEGLRIEQDDLFRGFQATSPSVLRDGTSNSPPVYWQDIGGLTDVKSELEAAVVWPLVHRSTYAALDLAPARGVLLTGAPGSGKTLLARALAQESGMNFIPVRPTRILSQFLGEAERAVADIFSRARQSAPTLIFFDEIDTLAPRRSGRDGPTDRIVAQLLTEIDGVLPSQGTVVLGATNRPAAIDPALLRPGRFDLVIDLPLPDATARVEILDVHCRGLPLDPELSFTTFASRTEGMSGADLATLVTAAKRHALSRTLACGGTEPSILVADFDNALRQMLAGQAARAADYIRERS